MEVSKEVESLSELKSDENDIAAEDDKYKWSDLFPVGETTDFHLIIWIRRIFLTADWDKGEELLARFPFWYGPETNAQSQVFWTENHMLAVMVSEFLLNAKLRPQVPHHLNNRLRKLIQFKVEHGIAEFLSAVYMPYTIGSLLNLYDFVADSSLQQLCGNLLDKISSQLLMFVLPGGHFLAPTARTYPKFLRQTLGHHIHQFIAFLTGIDRAQLDLQGQRAAFLSECLRTTTYRPSEEAYKYFNCKIDQVLQVSPSREALMEFCDNWQKEGQPLEDIITVLWSYGVYADVDRFPQLIDFVNRFQLWNHPHFARIKTPLYLAASISTSMVLPALRSIARLSFVKPYNDGSCLADASVYVFRDGTVLLASLQDFNSGCAAFQQWPWVANIAGIPIWCYLADKDKQHATEKQSKSKTKGKQKTPKADAITRSRGEARIFPRIHQAHNVLIADYNTSAAAAKFVPTLHWPEEEFDEHGNIPFPSDMPHATQWKFAIKGNAAVAYSVVRQQVTIVVQNLAATAAETPDQMPCTTQESEQQHTSDGDVHTRGLDAFFELIINRYHHPNG